MTSEFTIDIRTLGAEQGSGVSVPCLCDDANEAVRMSKSIAEDYGYNAPQREGQFICEVLYGQSKKVVRSYRIVKKSGGVLVHQPDCRCTECGQIYRMNQLLAIA